MTVDSIEIYNFFCYYQQILNLSEYSGITLISGENGHGKSTIYDAIQWNFYGTTNRYGNHSDEVIGRFDSYSSVSVDLIDENNKINILRYVNHKTYGNAIILTINGKQITNKKSVNSDVQCKINSILGMDQKTFVTTTMAHQNAFSSFANATDKEKKELMQELLGLGDLTKALVKVRDTVKIKKDDLFKLSERQQAISYNIESICSSKIVLENSIKADDDRINTELSENSSKITLLREKEEEQDDYIASLEKDKSVAIKDTEFLNEEVDQIKTDLTPEIEDEKEILEDLKIKLKDAESEEPSDLVEAKEKLQEMKNEGNKQTKPVNTFKIKTLIKKLENQLRSISLDIMSNEKENKETLKAMSDTLEQVGIPCVTCGRPITKEVQSKVLTKLQNKLNDLEESRKSFKDPEEVKIKISNHEKEINDLYKKAAEQEAKISILDEELKIQQDVIDMAEDKWGQVVENAVIECDNQEEKISKMIDANNEDRDRLLEKLHNMHNDLIELEKRIKRETIKLQDLSNDISEISKKIKKLKHEKKSGEKFEELDTLKQKAKAKKKELTEVNNEIKSVRNVLNHYAFWEKGFGDGGLKSFIMEGYIPELNSTVKEYNKIMTNNTVKVSFSATTQLKRKKEKREKFQVVVENSIGASKYEGNSGGERMRIDLSIFMTLQKIGRKNKFKQIFLDEIGKELDTDGVTKFIELLQYVYKADGISSFITSHDENFKNNVFNKISVVKNYETVNNVSSVVSKIVGIDDKNKTTNRKIIAS